MRIEFFYDVVSPYSLLAFEVVERYAPIWGATVVHRPFFLGGVMQATGNAPPAALPARAKYLAKDMQRKARFFKVPMKTPKQFPFNSLGAMRVLTAVKKQAPELIVPASRSLWRVGWQAGLDVSDPMVVAEALEHDTGADAAQVRVWLTASQEQETKDELKATTQDAIDKGAFGAPTFFVSKAGQGGGGDEAEEMFFGSDRFDVMCDMFDLPWAGPDPSKAKL